jgi:alkylated DNA repair protein (DNA oxidative demethylase)
MTDQKQGEVPPIISISLGDCNFRFGNNESRTGEHQDIQLKSGDLFVFGGRSRMAFHAVSDILPSPHQR